MTAQMIIERRAEALQQYTLQNELCVRVYIDMLLSAIEESPGDELNDLRYGIARALIEAGPDRFPTERNRFSVLREHISNPNLDPSPLLSEGLRGDEKMDAISQDEFRHILSITFEMLEHMGLAELVRKNPMHTREYLFEQLASAKVIRGTPEHLFLCEMALYYQSFHHSSELLDALDAGPGGVGQFIEDRTNESGWRIEPRTQRTPADRMAAAIETARPLLVAADYEKALVILEEEYRIGTILLGQHNMTAMGAYPDLPILLAVIRYRIGDFDGAEDILSGLVRRRDVAARGMALILTGNGQKIKENEGRIDRVFATFVAPRSLTIEQFFVRYADVDIFGLAIELEQVLFSDKTLAEMRTNYADCIELRANLRSVNTEYLDVDANLRTMERYLGHQVEMEVAALGFGSDTLRRLQEADKVYNERHWEESVRMYEDLLGELWPRLSVTEPEGRLVRLYVARFYNQLGVAYINLDQGGKALQSLDEARRAFSDEDFGDSYMLGVVLNNIGSAYRSSAQLALAERALLESIRYNAARPDNDGILTYSYGHLCDVMIKAGRPEEACGFCTESIESGGDSADPNQRTRACESVALLKSVKNSCSDSSAAERLVLQYSVALECD